MIFYLHKATYDDDAFLRLDKQNLVWLVVLVVWLRYDLLDEF